MGTLGNSLVAPMNGYVKLVGLGLEFHVATRAYIRLRHQYDVRHNKDQRNGNGDIIPRNVRRLAKPIDRARGTSKRNAQQKGKQICFFHDFTAFL